MELDKVELLFEVSNIENFHNNLHYLSIPTISYLFTLSPLGDNSTPATYATFIKIATVMSCNLTLSFFQLVYIHCAVFRSGSC